MVRRGAPWVTTYDIIDGDDQDLYDESVWHEIYGLLSGGAFVCVCAGPVCSSFSKAIVPAIRSREHPYDLPGISPKFVEKCKRGNYFVKKLVEMIRQFNQSMNFLIENLDSSWLFALLEVQSLVDKGIVGTYRCDMCAFGTLWRKRTRFICTLPDLLHQKNLCQCRADERHIVLRGSPKGCSINWAKIAESYPRALCEMLALCVCRTVGWSRLKLDTQKTISEALRKRRGLFGKHALIPGAAPGQHLCKSS